MADTSDVPSISTGRRITLVSVGSRGDVQPYVALGLALKARGNIVTIATEARLEPLVREFGLTFAPLVGDSAGVLFEPAAQKALHEGSFLSLMRISAEWEKRWKKEDILASYVAALAGADVIISGGLSLTPSFCVAEKQGAAWLPMILGCTLPTREFPLFMLSFLTLGLSCLNKWTYRVAFDALWGQEKASIAPWRASLGLPPMNNGGVAAAIAALRPPVLLACSSLVCGPRRTLPEDYPPECVLGGFAFAPAPAGAALAPELEAFLAAAEADGVRVVYFGFGSMPAPNPAALRAMALEVCGALGVRGVLLAGWSATLPSAGGQAAATALFCAASAPHDVLFPRCAALCHHAGIGTCAAALRAGVPQVPCPVMLDQPHNSKLMVGLGVAPGVVPYASLSAVRLGAQLKAVLGSQGDGLRERARAAAAHVQRESAAGLERMCLAVEGAKPPAAWAARR
jgi:sterol 3beta-glucosyltransferase